MAKNNLLFFFLWLVHLLFINFYIHAQEHGKPFMQIYSNIEYQAGLQNWCITEDNRGIIYVGNNDDGILEFDGSNWRHIPLTNLSIVRSLALGQNGFIYVGGFNELGFLSPDPQGKLHYSSLISLVDTSKEEFGDIWSTNSLGKKVFFQSRNTLFLYENNNIKYWNISDSYHRSFVVNNNFYLRQENLGLTVFQDDTLMLINDGALFANEFISAMIPFSETEILIGTRTKGLFLLDEKTNHIKSFPTEVNEFLSKNMLYHGVKIGKTKFAFATLRNGIVIINRNGELVQAINKDNGLPTKSVYYLHNQNDESLWLGMQRDLARIDIGYPMVYWDKDYGIDGTIFDIEKVNDIFYIATVQSVSYWKDSYNNEISSGKFNKIDGISAYVWDLVKYKVPCHAGSKEHYKLMAIAYDGIYEINGTKAKLISNLQRNLQSYCPKKNPYVIFISNDEGLYQIQYNCNTKTWNTSKKILSFPDEIRFISEDKYHNLWLASSHMGCYRVSFNHIDTISSISNYSFEDPYKIKRFYTESGFPEKSECGLQIIDNDLVFLSDSGIFRFNEETELYYPDSLMNKQLSNIATYRSIQDSKGHIWIDGQEHFIKQSNGVYKNDPNLLKRIEIFDTKCTFNEKDDIIWFGENNLYKLNASKSINDKRTYPTLLRKIIINKDSLIFGGAFLNDSNKIVPSQTKNLIPTLDYQYNSITFEFSSPYFIEQQYVQYCCMLDGFDNSWSEWSKETKKEYTNLLEGEYIFKVKAKNIYNVESTIASYKFIILSPWYRTLLAYMSYVFLLGLLIILIVKIYSKRLKQANIRLENIVKERTSEILKKNKELAKLSIVAKETDNAIVIMDAEGNYEWFNEAHKRIFGYEYEDFIKTVGSNILTVTTNKNIKKVVEDCIKHKKSVIYESSGVSLNRRKFWTQVTLSPVLSKNGEVEKLITIEADIRKIKEYEKELALQRDELAEANATKDKFFSIIAHDLKSPFNAILGFAEMLDENIPVLTKEKITKFNYQVLTAAKQLYNLIENLLSWSRAKSGKINSYPKNINIAKLIEDTCSVMIISAEKKGIKIYKEISREMVVFADEDLVSLILRNLLSNAIKYSNENGIITIKAINKPKLVEISIIDAGIGIKKENIDNLFRENVHYTTQGTSQEKGTGLGLILCKDFVEKSGGKIWVESEEGKGTTFSFSLPKPS